MGASKDGDPGMVLFYFSDVIKLMNFIIFDKACVFITSFEGGVSKCPPKAGEVLCPGGEKSPSPLDRGCSTEGES